MKQRLFSIATGVALCASAFTAQAQLNGDGYYRGENYMTGRYIYVVDDKGSISSTSTQADVGACALWLGFTSASSDPSTILFLDQIGGKTYDIAAQGTSVHTFIDHYLTIAQSGSGSKGPTYMVYATQSGAARYLGDSQKSTMVQQGEMSTTATGDYRKWYILPVEAANNDRYFGIKPTVTAGGKYYHPLYASFPYSAYSEGVKFYEVVKIDGDMAVIKEISGTVAGATGIIVECDHPLATDNRLNVGGSASKPASNLLKGVYFNNSLPLHLNRTKYDPKTMRLLSSDANGNLVYTTGSIDYLPANQSYLPVPSNAPATLRVVTEEQYQQELLKRPTSVTLAPATSTIDVGGSVTLTADVLPATADKTVTWTSSNTAVATVSNGVVKGLSAGSATITVKTVNGLSATATVTVRPETTGVTLSQTSATLDPGQTLTLTATVQPENSVNKTVTWTSSNTAVATVNAQGVVTAVAKGTADITVKTVNGHTAVCKVTVRSVAESVTISQTSATLDAGQTLTLTANVLPEDAIDKSVTWTSSNTAVATVSTQGVVTAVAKGTADITVKTVNGHTAVCKVTVRPIAQSVAISQTSATLDAGQTLALTATVLPDDAVDKSVTWTSSNTEVATVNTKGLVTAVAKGTADITVKTVNGHSAVCTVTVRPVAESVAISQDEITLEIGEQASLTATVMPEDAVDKSVTWESSNVRVVTVSESGELTAIGRGVASVTVTTVNGLRAACAVNVIDVSPKSISVEPESLELTKGTTANLKATVLPENASGYTLTWTTSDRTVANVSAAGMVAALTPGEATITVTTSNGLSATVPVVVKDRYYPVSMISFNTYSASVEEGESFDIVATVSPSNATDKTLTWTSSDESVATVEDGHVTTHAPGQAVITASAGTVEAKCNVTVTEKHHAVVYPEGITLSETSLSIAFGESFTLTATITPEDATETDVRWKSSDESVVRPGDAEGEFVAVGGGSAVITATTVNGRVATCEVFVKRGADALTLETEPFTLTKGQSERLHVEVAPADANDYVLTWTSSDADVAVVTDDGEVTAVGAGEAIITVAASDEVYASTVVTVIVPVESLVLDPTEITIMEGEQGHVSASVLPVDATSASLTWMVDDENVVEILSADDEGCDILVKSTGSARLIATTENGVSGVCRITGTSGVEMLLGEEGQADVYTGGGILLRRAADAAFVRSLAPGLYIIGGRKVIL